MNQLLTVIVQTSPIPSHPSTALLQALFRSFDHVDGLRECRILIVADGCDEIAIQMRQRDSRGAKYRPDSAIRYQQHLKQLQHDIAGLSLSWSAESRDLSNSSFSTHDMEVQRLFNTWYTRRFLLPS